MKKISPFIVTFILVILDQIVKIICLKKLKPISSLQIIEDFFYLTYVENRGAAFGILQGATWIFSIIAIIALIFCFILYKKIKKNKFAIFKKISLILIISGAIGNLIDRVFRGYVIDMFHFIFWGKDFAVFNIADVLVCIGTSFTAIIIALSDSKAENL